MSPLILLTFILYPRLKDFELKDYLGLALELINIFDIMELTDDIQYINDYGIFWLILYFISTLTGILLISYPVEIDSDDLNWENYRKTHVENVETGNKTSVSNQPSTNYRSCERIETGRTENKTMATSNCYCKFKEMLEFDFTDETDRVHFRKILKALLTMIFVDILFATIRLKVMITEQSVELGFNMVVKNFILAFLHLSYLLSLCSLRGELKVQKKTKPLDSASRNDNGQKNKYLAPQKRNKRTSEESSLL